MKSGIYFIINNAKNMYYVGQSVDIKRRLLTHKSKLKNNRHYNSYLQRHYNKYGNSNFSFVIIEKCPINDLDIREKYWIETMNSMDRNFGYNRESGGSLGKIFSDDRIKSITGKGNPMYGKKHTKEFSEMIRRVNRGSSDKLSEEDVRDIKISLFNGAKQSELTQKYCVKLSTINKIAKCHNWEWVEEHLNEKLINLSAENKNIKYENAKKMFNDGYSIAEISRKLKSNHSTINKLLLNEIKQKKEEINCFEKEILQSHINGMSKSEIVAKYGIGNKPYTRIVLAYKKNKEKELIEKCVKLRKKGFMVKEIAKTLGIHRTTVTKYTKNVNTEVIN